MGRLGLVRMGWLVEGVFAEGGNRVRRADDMKSSVVMVAIVSILGLHICVTKPRHGFVH